MIKRIEKLRRHYPHLTVHERVQLLLSAEQSGDLREMHVLDHSCPGEDIQPYIVHILALEHAAGLVVTQLLAWEVLLNVKLGTGKDETDAGEQSDPDVLSLLARQAALWRGFVAWCHDVGHDPRHVLFLAPLGLDEADPARFIIDQQIERLDALSRDLLSEPEQTQVWRDFFTQSYPVST